MSIKPISNPTQRFTRQQLEWLEEPPHAALEVYEERAATIVQENKSPDIGFRFSINPYRGCFHACAYCYARPTHQYIDFGAGTDFDRKIVAKVNAPERLAERFDQRSWKGDEIVFSGVTDCYQPLEAHYELTKRCLEVCKRYRNPVGIITKGCLIRRDIPLLVELRRLADVQVFISLAFIDDEMSKLIEPHAPRPSARLRALRELADAGIPVGVGVAPVIPGLNDTQIPELLAEAKAAGATSAFMTLLRLPQEVAEIFDTRLSAALPQRHAKVMAQLRRMRGGRVNTPAFGERMSGQGNEWEAVRWIFDSTAEKLGLNVAEDRDVRERRHTFQRPGSQLELFPCDRPRRGATEIILRPANRK